jgi:hypothetical protein
MAGVLLHYLALEQIVADLTHTQAVIGCDNTPAVAWTRLIASQAASPVLHRLLCGMAMHQRTTRAAPTKIFHTQGERNILADVASRVIANQPKISNADFLAHFNHHFPLPQSPSWTRVTLDFTLCSNVILMRGQRLEL